jgi:hypothetical protein
MIYYFAQQFAMECFYLMVRALLEKNILFSFLFGLELVGEGKLGGLLLQLGELVLVLGDLLEGWLDELAFHVTDGDGELIDLKVAQDDLPLQKEHLSLELVPLVKVLLADLLQIIHAGVVNVSLGAASLGNDTETLLGFAFLLLLELLSSLLTEKSSELLLTLGGHKSLLLTHGWRSNNRSETDYLLAEIPGVI